MDKIIPKFKGIKAYEDELSTKSSVDFSENIEAEEQIRPKKRKSLEIDPKLKAESNEKRLKSLKEKLDFDKRQQILVKEAINSGQRVNKRIVFDDNIDDQIGDKIDNFLSKEKDKSSDNLAANSKSKKTNLFDTDSEDDSNEDNNKLKDFDLDFDKKINDKNAEKLIELSSRFAHDSRFKIDERFFDQKEDIEEEVDEKQKNLHLLEGVLGKKFKPIIKSSDKKNKKSENTPKNELFVSRFDPKSDKSSEFEVKSSLPEKKSNKKVTFDEKVLSKEDEKEAEEVSKEVYYEVSTALKDSLSQKEESFSLTQMFGTSSVDDSKEKKSSEDGIVKPFYDKIDKKRKSDVLHNPFRYDSSSSDEEEVEEEVVIKTKSKPEVVNKSKPSFRFFFDKNDSRFKEDIFWDRELVQKARNNWKDRQIMIMRGMTVRKKSAKKNEKAKVKSFLKYKNKNNSNFKRLPKKDNQNTD